MSIHIAKSRSILLFEESIKSKYTRKNYFGHLHHFRIFAKAPSIDDLASTPSSKIQNLLEDYLIQLKRGTNPNSIPSKFQGIKHFCIMNDIDINWRIIQKMFPQKQKPPSLRCYTTQEIKELLSNTKSVRDKALIHFLASTGARIGVFDHDLLIGDLKRMESGCNAVRLYSGHVEEYWAFLTPQATRVLVSYHNDRKRHGEIFSECTPIFATRGISPVQLGWSGARSVVYRATLRSRIRKIQGNRYDVQADHGFRKRFNTILKMNNSVNYNIAEKLMGHKNGLDGVYLTPTIEQCFAEFKKAIPDLTV